MLCFMEKFFKESRAGLLTVVWQMTCQRSHICWCASCWHHVFVLLVQFALAHLTIFKILSGITRDWRHFAWRRLPYKSICLSNVFVRSMFALIPLFVDFVRYLTFWHDMIQMYRCSRKKSVDYFVCSICCYGIDQVLFHQLKVFG